MVILLLLEITDTQFNSKTQQIGYSGILNTTRHCLRYFKVLKHFILNLSHLSKFGFERRYFSFNIHYVLFNFCVEWPDFGAILELKKLIWSWNFLKIFLNENNLEFLLISAGCMNEGPRRGGGEVCNEIFFPRKWKIYCLSLKKNENLENKLINY